MLESEPGPARSIWSRGHPRLSQYRNRGQWHCPKHKIPIYLQSPAGYIGLMTDSAAQLSKKQSRSALREILRGVSIGLPIRVAGAALAFLFSIALARTLGAEGIGLYYLALNIGLFGSVVGRLGLDNVVLRFFSAHAAERDWSAVRGIYTKSIGMGLVASAITTVCIWFMAPWLSNTVFKEPALLLPLRIFALGIVPFSLLNLHAEILKAIQRVGLAVFIQNVGVMLIALPLFLLFGSSLATPGAAATHVFGQLCTSVLAVVLVWRMLRESRDATPAFPTIDLLKPAGPLFWIAVLNLVLGVTDSFMIGYFMESEQVGLFSVASRVVFLSSMVLVVMNSVVAPKLSIFSHRQDYQAFRHVINTTTIYMALLAALILFLLVGFAAPILSLFGDEFPVASREFTILAVGQFFVLATGPVAYALMMMGHERTHRNIVFFSAIVNVALNAWLIPLFGITGAAIATASSLLIKNVLAFVLLHAKVRQMIRIADGT